MPMLSEQRCFFLAAIYKKIEDDGELWDNETTSKHVETMKFCLYDYIFKVKAFSKL